MAFQRKRKDGSAKGLYSTCPPFEIKPDAKQLETLLQISAIHRELWNAALNQYKLGLSRYDVEKGRQYVTYLDQQAELTIVRHEFPEVAAVNRTSEEATLHRLHDTWKSFYRLKKQGDWTARPPRYIRKDYFCTITYGVSGAKVKSGRISFSHKIPGGAKLDFPIPEYQSRRLDGHTICRVHIYRTFEGKFQIAVTYEYPAPEIRPKDINRTVFVEIGTGSIGMVSMDLQVQKVQRQRQPQNYWGHRISAIKKRLKSHQKGSRKWMKLHARKREMERKEKQQRINFQRSFSRKLMDYGDVFVVGDHEVRLALSKSKTGSKRTHREVQNTGSLARLTRYIQEKAKEQGKHVILVSDYPTAPKLSGEITGAMLDGRRIQATLRLRDHFLAAQ